MSAPDDLTNRVLELIEEYIRPGNHLLTMQRIHKNTFEEDIEFTRWAQVINRYQTRTWTPEEVRKFARVSKQIVENSSGSIPESYFSIHEPDSLSVDYVCSELDGIQYNEDAEGEDMEGFDYEVDNGVINGRYVYVDVETEVYYSGDMDNLTTEGAIEFRIDPSKKLLIIQSTRVPEIQKARKYFGKKTNMEIGVCGDLTIYTDSSEAVRRIDSFRDAFETTREDVDDEPALLRIDNIQLTDPTVSDDIDDETIEKIDFDGKNIADHEEIRDYTNEGWIIKGFEAPVFYKGDNYDLKLSGNEVMGYVRIKNVSNFDKGQELVDILRERYLEHIA